MSESKQAILTLYETLDKAKRMGWSDFALHTLTAIRRIERQRKRWKWRSNKKAAA